jgi:hypothetical protein
LYTLATNNENEIATTEGVSAGANSSQGVHVILHLILVFKLYVVTPQSYHQTVAGGQIPEFTFIIQIIVLLRVPLKDYQKEENAVKFIN